MNDPFLNFIDNAARMIPDLISNFSNWAVYYYYNYKPLIENISLVVSGILLWFIGYYVIKMEIIEEKVDKVVKFFGADVPKKQRIRAWTEIVKKFNTKNPEQIKDAVKSADKIFDELMKVIGTKGKSVDERLAQITEAQILNLNDVKIAHDLSKRIGENPDFEISHDEAKEALKTYQKVFRDFGLID